MNPAIIKIKPNYNSHVPHILNYTWQDENGNILGQEEILELSEIIGSEPLPIRISLSIDTGECIFTESILIDNIVCSIPEGFSPNGDGFNDSFDLSFMEVQSLLVFNRHGRKVYSKTNYTNEWIGQDNSGNSLPTGTYYYTIKTSNGQTIEGWVYLNK